MQNKTSISTAGSNGTSCAPAGRLTEDALAWQQRLEINQHDVAALMGISLVAMATGQAEAALSMARAAVNEDPEAVTAWVTLGQALKAAGQYAEAEQAYGEAIRRDGANALPRLGLGELKIATGHWEEAVHEYELALRQQPGLASACLGLGHALACGGRNQSALHCYDETLKLRPRLAEAEFGAGFVLVRLGRLSEAEVRYRRAISWRPDFAAAWMNLGCLLREQGRELYAEAALARAVELRKDLIAGWLNLAQLERERRRPARAEICLKKALDIDPKNVDTLVAWCQFRAAEKDPSGAWHWLCRAMARDARHAEAVNMLGILLHNEGRFEEAVAAFGQAEALGSRAATSNRGNSLIDLGRETDALRAHESAVERDPASAGAAYNLALTRLRLGEWESGWAGYETRWNFREVHRGPRVFAQPRWQGEPLHGRRVLLHAEQGLGDTIQFSRYAAMVAARGGTAILQVQASAERLMRSLPAARAGLVEIAVLGGERPAFDLECPLMSLPAVFGTTVDTVPWPGVYLAAEPGLLKKKRRSFRTFRRGLRVGFSWAGNPGYKADQRRSVPLARLLPLLRARGVNWISLQKGDAARQLDALPDDIFVWDGSSQDVDLAETAALVATLDLLVTTDTCIAHLAGAMGKPVWMMLPHVADWRWMQRIDSTPWYPTARLFRQAHAGDWDGLQKRIIAELAAFPRPQAGWPGWIVPQSHSAAAAIPAPAA
jgi:tetratricopeptide (TPR) repeat protein